MGSILKLYILVIVFHFLSISGNCQQWEVSEIPFNARIVHTMTSNEDGYYILGGRLLNGKGRSNKTLLVNRKRNFQSFKSIDARDGQTIVTTDQNELLAFGGISKNGIHNDLWIFQDNQWEEVKVLGKKPSKRWGHAAIYSGGKLFIFGGKAERKEGFYNDLWMWDGSSWEELKSTIKPPKRYGTQLGVLKGKLVLYGGRNHSSDWYKDTWIWNNGWVKLSPNSKHQPRASVGFVLITTPNKLFLIGGIFKGNNYKETWEFNGEEWRLTDNKLPFSLDFPAGCYDVKSNAIIISGANQNRFELWKLSL